MEEVGVEHGASYMQGMQYTTELLPLQLFIGHHLMENKVKNAGVWLCRTLKMLYNLFIIFKETFPFIKETL